MNPAKCPVCKGKGKTEVPSFDKSAGNVTSKSTLKQCHGCKGKGWVSVPEKDGQ